MISDQLGRTKDSTSSFGPVNSRSQWKGPEKRAEKGMGRWAGRTPILKKQMLSFL